MRNARRSFLHWSLVASVAATGALGASVAQAQADYPNKPIRLIVPYPAGGGADTF